MSLKFAAFSYDDLPEQDTSCHVLSYQTISMALMQTYQNGTSAEAKGKIRVQVSKICMGCLRPWSPHITRAHIFAAWSHHVPAVRLCAPLRGCEQMCARGHAASAEGHGHPARLLPMHFSAFVSRQSRAHAMRVEDSKHRVTVLAWVQLQVALPIRRTSLELQHLLNCQSFDC